MAIGFAGLSATSLSHVSAHASTERHQLVNVSAHALGHTYDDLKITTYSGQIACFLEQLQIAARVGEGSGPFIGRSGREDDLRKRCCLRKEQLLRHHECVFEHI